MRPSKLAISVILAAVFFVPDTAEAHGRLPRVTRISFAPDGAVLARTTFGLLVSRDSGAEWDLVCGRAVGFDAIEDPVFASGPDGALYATTSKGLSISRDRACSWTTTGGAPFVDVTPDGQTSLSSRYEASSGATFRYDTRLWRAGASVGAPIDPSIVPNSFVVAGSRIDVAAVRYDSAGKRTGVLLTSKDDGATWAETPVTLVSGEERIAAVGGDGDRVFLGTLSKGASRLLVHDSGGERVVHESARGISGIAFSPDRSEMWIAEGADGIRHASTKDFAFEKVSSFEASCLAYDARGLWACAEQWKAGFVVGVSRDGGRSFEKRLELCGVRGDLACANGCAGEWAQERRELGCDAATPADAGSAPPPVVVTSEGPSADPPAAAGCSLGPSRTPSTFAFVVALIALLVRGRRVQSTHGGRELGDDQAARRSPRVR